MLCSPKVEKKVLKLAEKFSNYNLTFHIDPDGKWNISLSNCTQQSWEVN